MLPRFLAVIGVLGTTAYSQYTTTIIAGAGPVNGSPATSTALYTVSAMAADAAGNVYYASPSQSRIYKITAAGVLSVVAGNGIAGYSGDGGPAINAQLNSPFGLAIDANGRVYICDRLNRRIRMIADGMISTVAGPGPAQYGGIDPTPRLSDPASIAIDSAGSLYIADSCVVRKVVNGSMSVFAGSGGYGNSGDDGPAVNATFSCDLRLAAGPAGTLYVADVGNRRIRKVSGSTITAFAGNGNYDISGDGVPALSTGIGYPQSIAADSSGNVYLSSSFDTRVRKVSGGILTIVAGNGSYAGSPGSMDGNGGPATSAPMGNVTALALDSSGTLYIAETPVNASRIRKVTAGTIDAFAGNGTFSTSGDGGPALQAQIGPIGGLATDSSGAVYVQDQGTPAIRKIANGTITRVAGASPGSPPFTEGGVATATQISPTGMGVDGAGYLYLAESARVEKLIAGRLYAAAGSGMVGYSGDGGPATAARIGYFTPIAVDAAGTTYVADQNRIRKVASGTITLFAGNGPADGTPAPAVSVDVNGMAADSAGNLFIASSFHNRVFRVSASNGTLSTFAGVGTSGSSGDTGPATAAELSFPSAVAIDATGAVYSGENGRIRKVAGGVITTVVGGGQGCPQQTTPDGDGCQGPSVSISSASSLLVDGSGAVYFADGNRVRRWSGGIVTTVVGTGSSGTSPDGTAATAAQLAGVNGLAFDSSGNLLISESINNRVRNVVSGVLGTFAGTGANASTGDGGPAAQATLSSPAGLAADNLGNIYIAEISGSRVRKVTAGIISTVAGGGAGNDGPATSASLNYPVSVATDTAGNLFIGERGAYRVRKVAANVISTVAGNGSLSWSGDLGPASNAQFDSLVSLATDNQGSVYVAENSRVRVIASGGSVTTLAGGGSLPSDGPARSVSIRPVKIAVDPSRNVFILDQSGSTANLRRISNGAVSTIAAIATSATFGSYYYGSSSMGLATDTQGSVYVGDSSGIVRKYSPASQACSYTISSDIPPVISGSGGGLTLMVNTLAGCSWSVSSGAPWVWTDTMYGGGAGPWSVTLTIQPNPSSSPRSATISVAGQPATITQAGSGCNYGVSATTLLVPAGGATGTLAIANQGGAGCGWSGASTADWIQFFPLTGTGSGSTNYSILPNFSTIARGGSISINGTPVIVQQAGATGPLRNRFVRLLYYYTLGRFPTQAEENFQVNSGASNAELAKNFYTSQEFALSGKMIAGLYVGLLARDAEYGGWIFQRNALRSGQVDALSLNRNFINSQEYGLRWGTQTDNQFVRMLYQNMLGRLPSPAEEAFQAGAVQTFGRPQIATNFTLGDEFRIGRLSQFDSFLLYAAVLNRDPTVAERQTARTRLDSGVTIDTILAELVNSAEFSQLLQ